MISKLRSLSPELYNALENVDGQSNETSWDMAGLLGSLKREPQFKAVTNQIVNSVLQGNLGGQIMQYLPMLSSIIGGGSTSGGDKLISEISSISEILPLLSNQNSGNGQSGIASLLGGLLNKANQGAGNGDQSGGGGLLSSLGGLFNRGSTNGNNPDSGNGTQFGSWNNGMNQKRHRHGRTTTADYSEYAYKREQFLNKLLFKVHI